MASDYKLPYSEESVWSVQFIRTQPGTTNAYLRQLSEAWKPLMEEAIRRGIILSYRLLLSNYTSPNDWDVMIMIELKNMAALDGFLERMRQLLNELGKAPGRSSDLFIENASEYMRLARQIALK